MKLLILGGTIFLGRHLVDAALARGHEVTLFNRGQHNPDLYQQVEKLRGDRDGDLAPLRGRTWDAVLDTCGYVPRVVRKSAQALADSVGHYTFISSISVYPEVSVPGIDERAPVGTLEDDSVEEVTGETYGPLKALCERAVEDEMPGRALNVRAGLIVGPYDVSDRFTYWPERAARGGEILGPGSPDAPVQIIDARDLADWCVRMAESSGVGVYNATGPEYRLTFGRMVETCVSVAGAAAHVTWVDDRFLLDSEVQPWMEMPLWIPSDDDNGSLSEVSIRKAVAAGLTFRPLETTVRDTLAWAQDLPADRPRRAGLDAEKERRVLEAWRARPMPDA